jgi:ubiquitin-activating enzyme E1 C
VVVNARRCEEHHSCDRLYQCHRRGYVHLVATNSCAHGEIASCCNEAFKIATSSAAYLNNYFMFVGTEGVYSHTFEHEKRADCPVCGGESLEVSVPQDWTVERLIEMLVEKQDMCVLVCLVFAVFSVHAAQIKKPSLSTPAKNIYLQAPPQLEAATRANLEKRVSEFVPDGGEVTVTATSLPFSLSLCIRYCTPTSL